MIEVTITRTIRAEQWAEGGALPAGVHLCRPEACWSADRSLIYFRYAELWPTQWLEAARQPVPAEPDKACGQFEGLVVYTPEQGEPYARHVFDFRFWSVKSEASTTGDHRPVYVDGQDAGLLALWHDYCAAMRWPNPIPRRAEYRDIDGSYGRGYRPVYLKSGDWLLRETVPDGHNNLGSKDLVRVVADEEFQRLRAGAAALP